MFVSVERKGKGSWSRRARVDIGLSWSVGWGEKWSSSYRAKINKELGPCHLIERLEGATSRGLSALCGRLHLQPFIRLAWQRKFS